MNKTELNIEIDSLRKDILQARMDIFSLNCKTYFPRGNNFLSLYQLVSRDLVGMSSPEGKEYMELTLSIEEKEFEMAVMILKCNELMDKYYEELK